METKWKFLWTAGGLLVLLVGITFGTPHHGQQQQQQQTEQQRQQQHICDASGESSEECNHKPVLSGLMHPAPFANVDSLTVKFYLYKNINNPDESIQIRPDLENLRYASPYPPSPNTMWKILIPGFPSNGKSPFPENVRDAYLQRMQNIPQDHYNILVVDWDRDTMCKLDTKVENTTLTYTAVIGEKVAEMLIFLDAHGFLNLSKDVHVVAFSMGVHVAGETSRFIFRKFAKKNLIYRISALEAAGGNFWPRGFITNKLHPSPMDRVPRIRRSFVEFLDVYHTSREYGIGNKLGDIDFFLNGGNGQPGCSVSRWGGGSRINNFADLCNHAYVTEIFAKSINDKSMEGCTGCDYYDLYKRGKCSCEDTPVLGEFVDEKKMDGYPMAVGEAFIQTGDLANFGKRFEKTLLDAGEPLNQRKSWYQLC